MSRWDRNTRLDEDQVHMILTQDEICGLNDGSFFLKRGIWADWILEMWTDQHYVEREVSAFTQSSTCYAEDKPLDFGASELHLIQASSPSCRGALANM